MKHLTALCCALALFSCSDPASNTPLPTKPASYQKGPSGERLVTAAVACTAGNKIEIDVRDGDPEYENPQNYRLELRLNGTLVASRNFDQECTLNNTFVRNNPSLGSYTYKITSTCTGQIYQGTIQYQGGYYATTVYISQSFCQ